MGNSQEKTLINDMTSGNITKQLIVFSIPFMLASLLQSLYTSVDMVIVGQWCGENGLSAVSVGSSVLMFFTLFAMGFSGASQVLIAQYVGKKDHDQIRKIIGTMLVFMGLVSIVLGLCCIVFARYILAWLHTPAEAYDGAMAYLRICGSGMLFIYGYNVVSAFLRGMGDSKRPLIFIAVAAVVNVILDLVLVAGCNMGPSGAAVATVVGQAVSVVFSLLYMYRHMANSDLRFKGTDLRIDGEMLKRLATLGIPMALQAVAIGLSSLIVSSFVNQYGVTASAITGVGQKLMGLVTVVAQAICTALSTMIGQNIAAKEFGRVRKLMRTALAFTLGSNGCMAVICLLFPRGVIGIFSQDPNLLDMAETYVPILTVSFIACGLMAPFNGIINGIGYAKLSFITGLLDGVVARVGLSLLFAFVMDMGIRGFWWGDALAAFVTAGIGGGYYLTGRWKTRKLIVEN